MNTVHNTHMSVPETLMAQQCFGEFVERRYDLLWSVLFRHDRSVTEL
jgi:hypothetical protein